jgi:hypothetical protein
MVEQFMVALFVEKPVLGFVLICSIVAAAYVIIEDLRGGSNGKKPQFQIDLETQERARATIEEINGRASQEIDILADLARNQIRGDASTDAAEEVRSAFERIDQIAEEHEHPDTQVWVRAVAGAFRLRVRRLVQFVDSNELDAQFAIEFLEDAHREATVGLLPKVFDDGQVKYRYPKWPDGTPVDIHGTHRDPEEADSAPDGNRHDRSRQSRVPNS